MQAPKLDPNKAEYPTDAQMTTMFNAYKNGGKAGMMEVLKAMREKDGKTANAEDTRP